jgi:hypothetical protein
VPCGYESPFTPDQHVLTLFSAPNCGYEYGNRGAVLHVGEDLLCRFAVFEAVAWKEEIGIIAREGMPKAERKSRFPLGLFDIV